MSTQTNAPNEQQQHTPLAVIATVSRVVSLVVDRITGDRSDYPLLVAAATSEALKNFGIESRVMYGPSAWIEILEDQSVMWAGCWNGNFNFWVATQYGEIVDLNTSIAHRKRAHSQPGLKPVNSPPMLWSAEVPAFYRYVPEGVAELELTDSRDVERFEKVLREVREKCTPARVDVNAPEQELEFPNEPILCPKRRLLDDSRQTFRHFDRALSISGLPPAPF